MAVTERELFRTTTDVSEAHALVAVVTERIAAYSADIAWYGRQPDPGRYRDLAWEAALMRTALSRALEAARAAVEAEPRWLHEDPAYNREWRGECANHAPGCPGPAGGDHIPWTEAELREAYGR